MFYPFIKLQAGSGAEREPALLKAVVSYQKLFFAGREPAPLRSMVSAENLLVA